MGKTYRNESDGDWEKGRGKPRKRKRPKKGSKNKPVVYDKRKGSSETSVDATWCDDYYSQDFEKFKKRT